VRVAALYDVHGNLPAPARLRGKGFPSLEEVIGDQVRGAVTAESATEYFEGLRGA
jgi:hypothetical protein